MTKADRVYLIRIRQANADVIVYKNKQIIIWKKPIKL